MQPVNLSHWQVPERYLPLRSAVPSPSPTASHQEPLKLGFAEDLLIEGRERSPWGGGANAFLLGYKVSGLLWVVALDAHPLLMDAEMK